MTMIDKLSGAELALAVAEYVTVCDGCSVVVDKRGAWVVYANVRTVYRPDRNIAQAWELVEELARGAHASQHNDMPPVACCVEVHVTDCIVLEPCDVRVFSPTLADVTATGACASEAICRAYLKVRGWRVK
jgi:hypothetical protein